VVLALVAGGALGGDGDVVKKELKRLEGTWQLLKAVDEGKAAPEEEVKNGRMVFTGDKLTLKTSKGTYDLRFTLDPSKDPQHITIHSGKGEDEKVSQGIYKLEKDQLTICVTKGRGPRPTTFASTRKLPTILFVLERVKK
jgi:uncharacterized protein (TIGR03067 family)